MLLTILSLNDYVLLSSYCFQFIFSHHQMQLSRSYSYNQSHHSYALYMQQRQQRRLVSPSSQHSHSSSEPVLMGRPIHRHCQVNEPTRQLPPMQRTRSGSEPIDPATVARDKSRSGVCYIVSFIIEMASLEDWNKRWLTGMLVEILT